MRRAADVSAAQAAATCARWPTLLGLTRRCRDRADAFGPARRHVPVTIAWGTRTAAAPPPGQARGAGDSPARGRDAARMRPRPHLRRPGAGGPPAARRRRTSGPATQAPGGHRPLGSVIHSLQEPGYSAARGRPPPAPAPVSRGHARAAVGADADRAGDAGGREASRSSAGRKRPSGAGAPSSAGCVRRDVAGHRVDRLGCARKRSRARASSRMPSHASAAAPSASRSGMPPGARRNRRWGLAAPAPAASAPPAATQAARPPSRTRTGRMAEIAQQPPSSGGRQRGGCVVDDAGAVAGTPPGASRRQRPRAPEGDGVRRRPAAPARSGSRSTKAAPGTWPSA